MKISEIRDLLGADVMSGEAFLENEVTSACCSDMMSDVLAYVKDQGVLLTGLVNPQVIRTANMMDMVCIVFVRNKKPSDEMIELAGECGIVVMCTSKRAFEATAAAEWLIARIAQQVEVLNRWQLRLQHSTQNILHREQNRLSNYLLRITSATDRLLTQEKNKLTLLQKTIELHSPERIFKMGYSLTTINGKTLKSIEDVKNGDILTTYLKDGNIQSIVK